MDAFQNGDRATYIEEQISIIREINSKKSYYEILGLERGCSAKDVRESYRKLSLKVHPDKNRAPGAEEAFKAVSKAFQCLSDEESRYIYDLSGEDESIYSQEMLYRRAEHGSDGSGDSIHFLCRVIIVAHWCLIMFDFGKLLKKEFNI
ncbi:Chaperone protein dnaJ 49 [Spatholobus suberectus]|nr:Chaperone protein dnaJ 49 [Spatholobus suberectus]